MWQSRLERKAYRSTLCIGVPAGLGKSSSSGGPPAVLQAPPPMFLLPCGGKPPTLKRTLRQQTCGGKPPAQRAMQQNLNSILGLSVISYHVCTYVYAMWRERPGKTRKLDSHPRYVEDCCCCCCCWWGCCCCCHTYVGSCFCCCCCYGCRC